MLLCFISCRVLRMSSLACVCLTSLAYPLCFHVASSLADLHRSKPAPSVTYARPMPDLERLMQEWAPPFDELLGRVRVRATG